MSEESRQNRLAGETSPYLLQHADNPVDWYPWGDEAIERARREKIPILLSVGYSACHWCHVMAHESFEDPAVAEVMNRLFVNVKVDREERPDLDRIYQIAHQLLNRRPGGWPLTLFLDPGDLTPFLAGTYFPKQAMQGMPAFPDLCQRVATAWEEQRDAIRTQGERLRDVIQDVEKPAEAGETPDPDKLLGEVFGRLRESFDERFGGFGSAPKFPHPTHLALADWLADAPHKADIDRAHAGRMRDQSLVRMAESGLFDQVGGGWYRYSVDPYWMIPHFEKMLYDNGPLLGQTAMRQGIHASLERAVPLSVDWLAREMTAPEGAFYATLDADSEGEEGRFYVWDRDEVREQLDGEVFEAFARRYGLDREPNFEEQWHLHAVASVEAVAEALDRDEATVREQIESARRVLFELRESRVRPGRDEKILTAWNGLMITGLATAATHDPQQTRAGELAAGAADFLLDTVQREDGRVWAVHKDGRNRFPGYLDDHVFLAEGLLALLQWDWREHWLTGAQRLMDAVLEHFRAEDGGFYFTADDQDRVLTRPRPLMDESTPSGNGVAARVLLRLGWLLAEPRYLEAGEACLASATGSIARMPEGHATLLIALAEQAEPPPLVVVRDDADGRARWRARLQPLLPPGGMLFTLAEDATGLPAALAGKQGQGAWLCTGTHCETVTDPQSLEARLTDWVSR